MSGGKGGKAWTPQEKLNLLMQVVDRINPPGRGIPLADLNMPGRTPKSLRHVWSHLRAEAAAYRQNSSLKDSDNGQEAEAAAATNGNRGNKKSPAKVVEAATPRRGSRQRTQKRSYSEWASDDEDKISVKRSCLSSDEDKKVEDSEEDNAVAIAKSKPIRSAKRTKKGEPKIKIEDPVDIGDGVESDTVEA
ncbi:hypothetical protein F4811DRAFT_171235 [Daldinia bambusicola]|nr:hypothetical protein F4811DRAFT_171235 [Daldinia bambusicola]